MQKTILFLCMTILLFAAVTTAAAEPSAKTAAVPARPPAPPALKLALPEVIYAAPGLESNIYFENVVDSAVFRNYAYEVRCSRGTQEETRWFWTPAEQDAGKTFDLELRIFNDCGMILSGTCKIVVTAKPASPEKKITLALLADSGVGCKYQEHMAKVMRERGFLNYTPVGSHNGSGKAATGDEVMHDGYGGFSWRCFLARWYYSEEELPKAQTQAEAEQMRALGVVKIPLSRSYLLRSPLLRLENGKVVLDVPGWLKKINQGNAPDFIIIELGGNDIFSCRPDTLDARVVTVMNNARQLLAVLRKHAPNAVIGVCTSLCGCGQDGFGANYQCNQSKVQFRRNAQHYNRELTAMVKSLRDPRISIVPVHQNLDPENSYMDGPVQAHARSTRKVNRFKNALHPSREGGYQLGDAIVCWLLKQLEK